MNLEDVAAAVEQEAENLDLVVGPVARSGDRVTVYLSSAHESDGTAIIQSNGVELLSLYLEEFHWPEFAHEENDHPAVIKELVGLAACTCSGALGSEPNDAGGVQSGLGWRSPRRGRFTS